MKWAETCPHFVLHPIIFFDPAVIIIYINTVSFIGGAEMDRDLEYIINEEQKLARMLRDAEGAARERIESHRENSVLQRDSEFEKIRSEYNRIAEMKLQEIKNDIERQSDELRREQERLVNDRELRKKITGRIVTIILENR